MEDQLKLAFELAAGLSNQLLGLSTAVLGLSVTFSKEIISGSIRPLVSRSLIASWSLYLISIGCGIWSLMALTGSLVPVQAETLVAPAGIGLRARLPAGLQVIFFFLGTVFQIALGSLVLREFKYSTSNAEKGWRGE